MLKLNKRNLLAVMVVSGLVFGNGYAMTPSGGKNEEKKELPKSGGKPGGKSEEKKELPKSGGKPGGEVTKNLGFDEFFKQEKFSLIDDPAGIDWEAEDIDATILDLVKEQDEFLRKYTLVKESDKFKKWRSKVEELEQIILDLTARISVKEGEKETLDKTILNIKKKINNIKRLESIKDFMGRDMGRGAQIQWDEAVRLLEAEKKSLEKKLKQATKVVFGLMENHRKKVSFTKKKFLNL
jgi:hypothetical protein